MKRTLGLIYCLTAYLLFGATSAYFVGFLTNIAVAKGIDDGAISPMPAAVAIDVLLLSFFGLQHSIMARASFKCRITKWLPPELERSTYIVASCVVLWFLFWLWRPIPTSLWHVDSPIVSWMLHALALGGIVLIVVANFLMDHFDFAGLRQGFAYFRNRKPNEPTFQTPGPYRWIRHPMMTGLIIALWATPEMSWGRFLFVGGLSLYVVIGIQWEEKDLITTLGDPYVDYGRKTPALIPFRIRRT